MKTKFYTLIIALLFSFTAFAQDCKYEKNEVDEFTNNKTVRLQKQLLFRKLGLASEAIEARISRVNDVTLVSFIITTSYRLSCFNNGDKIYLKLENGEVLTLSNSDIECGDYNVSSYTYYLMSSLTNPQIENLKQSNLAKIRIGSIEGEATKKGKIYFKSGLNCL